MKDAMACDFSKISSEWNACFKKGCCGVDARNWGGKCAKSEYRLFKTINANLNESVWLLDATDNLQLVHIERDPRSIYASQQAAWHKGQHSTSNLLKFCKMAAENIKISHPRLHKVRFHELVSDPFNAFESLMNKLSLPMTQLQKDFIRENFNNPNCTEHTYSTCKKKSQQSIRKWERFLNPHDQEAFKTSSDCQTVEKFYGYDLLASRFPEDTMTY
jgi:hypothetical protein